MCGAPVVVTANAGRTPSLLKPWKPGTGAPEDEKDTTRAIRRSCRGVGVRESN